MDENDQNKREEQLDLVPGGSWERRDKLFDDFDAEDEFEESDRDSDFATVFTEVEEEEPDLPDEPAQEQPAPFEQDPVPDSPWENDGDNAVNHSWDAPDDTWVPLATAAATDDDIAPETTDGPWEEDEEDYYEEEEREISLPLGMIIVGIIALVLLGAGGYGVMQDRAAMQEEIRQLHATLATTASPKEVAETRTSSDAVSSRNRELQQQLTELSRENRSLQAIVAGLETQLQAQQAALTKAAAPAPAPVKATPPTKKASARPKPAAPAAVPTTSATTAATGSWFVNFGSYSQRATAESWAKRLQPESGEVIVTTGEKEGRIFYRVRVVNLANKSAADSTARKLEQKYDLSRLWIGQAG